MNSKLIFDPIHGYIELPLICMKIIDTEYFQQLRYKKQLGAAYYIFPGASHNRFEHSIGTCYLAGKLIKQIKINQPNLNISDKDIILIMLAGLLHDVGHGPMSHLFDNHIITDDTPEKHHEYRSGLIIDKIFETYDIDNILDEDINKIKKYINPGDNDTGFLYHIISNKINDLDVDKFDYIMRDTKSIGLPYTIDCSRLLLQARVIDNEICYPEKLNFTIYNLFGIRYRLHKEIYTHPGVEQIEFMFVDILKESNNYFKLNESIYNMDKFIKLNDTILNYIEFSTCDELKKSRELLYKFRCRKLYKYIGYVDRYHDIDYTTNMFISYSNNLNNDDFIITNTTIGYTNNITNPVDNVSFYKFNDINNKFKIKKNEVSQILPTTFNESISRIYCKNVDKLEEVQNTFNKFKNHINMIIN